MSDTVNNSANSSAAADNARRAAEEAARRAAQQAQQQQQVQQQQVQQQQQVEQQQQQQPALSGVEQAAQTRDVVAAASVDNESAKDAASRLALSPTSTVNAANAANTDVPLPESTTSDPNLYAPAPTSKTRSLAHDPATGAPEAQPTAQAALQAAVAGPERQALGDQIARAAGLEPTRAGAPSEAEVRQRAESTAAALVDAGKAQELPAGFTPNASQQRRLDNMPLGNPELNLTPAQKSALRDPATREATAAQIGRDDAERRAFAKTFGGPENAAKAEAAWQKATPQQRRDLADQAAQHVDTAAAVGGAPANAVASLIPFTDAAGKLIQGDVNGATQSAAIDTGLMLAGGVIGKAVAPVVGAVAGPVVAGAKKALGLGDDVAAPAAAAVTNTTTNTLAKNADDVAARVVSAADVALPGMGATKLGLIAQELRGEVLSGTSTAIAGAGTNTVLRDAERLAAQYGGNAADWAKVTSTRRGVAMDGTIIPSAGQTTGQAVPNAIARPATVDAAADANLRLASFEVHAYRNTVTGQVVEPKLIAEIAAQAPRKLPNGNVVTTAMERYEIRDLSGI